MTAHLKTTTKNLLQHVLPVAWERGLRTLYDRLELSWLSEAESCNSDVLMSEGQLDLLAIFSNSTLEAEWVKLAPQLESLTLPQISGGVNAGDRRALFYLIRALQPQRVLEIGTHVGFSTLHIAKALQQNAADTARLITVDIADVNSPGKQPWAAFGLDYSPAGLLEQANCRPLVEFVTADALTFLDKGSERFDFIFLDGSHTATAVYQEVPKALKRLNPGGVILLHDYYPDLKPLWSDNQLIPGPYLALRRLQQAGCPLAVAPLGDLPWPTKLGTHRTSLALVLHP